MTREVISWNLNRSAVTKSVVVKNNTVGYEPTAILYEYVGLVKSASRPGKVHHTVVRVKVDTTGKTTLAGYSCDCEGFAFRKLCRHIKALYNVVERDALARAKRDLPDAIEINRMIEEAQKATFSLDL
jgi:hypothetical protein